MNLPERHLVREAVGVFGSEQELQAVIDELLISGFDRADLSLLASMDSVRPQLGRSGNAVRLLEDDPDVSKMAYISKDSIAVAEGAVFSGFFYVGALATLIPVLVSGGALAAALMAVGLGGGAGGTIGAILARAIGHHHAAAMEKQLTAGGLILWVRTSNRADEERAIDILTRHSGSDVHLHGLPDQSLVPAEPLPAESSGTEMSEYNGQTYAAISERGYRALGMLFPNEQGAKACIDRHNALEAIQAAARTNGLDLEAALTHPSAVFESPAGLMTTALPDSLKIEILKRWAYAEKQRDIATNDGMPPSNASHHLQDIQNAILRLGAV